MTIEVVYSSFLAFWREIGFMSSFISDFQMECSPGLGQLACLLGTGSGDGSRS
jgi:hypothetical protein